jgi:hypothetical protein
MNKNALIGILAGSVCLTLACLCAPTSLLPFSWTPTLLPPTAAPSPTFTLVPPTEIPTLFPTSTFESSVEISSACVSDLAQELHTSETTYTSGKPLAKDYTLVTYRVSGNEITDPFNTSHIPPELTSYQQDIQAHKNLWHFFTNIIPAEQRTMITGFSVFTDGPSNSLGAVEQADNPHDWILDMDIEDSQNFADMSSTLVHEFGHLLSLNDTQVTPDLQVFNHPTDEEIYRQAAANCPTYFIFEGCSLPDSFLNQFFQQFWPGIYDDWKSINTETDEDVLYQKLSDFYHKHHEEFVSRYSVTSPTEDIAESFMYFIFTPKPAGEEISGQKILFFYGYPELTALRERILSSLCTYVIKP